ncbi:hypothetical protein Tco_0652141 [Tanacetum coccineum]|uniref:Uncharacterized protein n=1 Tax=Tanacetum coccineum TaxID=301880 RepID=A0ABQ4WWR8_9ASTR
MSKEVGTPRYPSLVVPLRKAGDEDVHKELGDRMERAATTASSLEAEQDSGSGPRCQDTILGDVDAQTRFEITSKQSNDPPLLRGYTLGSREDSMKLLELMELCTQLSYKNRKSVLLQLNAAKLKLMLLGLNQCCPYLFMLLSIQFLLLVYINAAKLMLMLLGSVNAVKHMLMLPVQVPAAKVNPIIQEGTDCLSTATIFEELAHIGVKSTAWNEFSSTMASLIICLATNQKFNLSKYIFYAMVKHLDGGVKFLMYLHFLQRAGKDFSKRITHLFDTIMVQASEEVGEDSDHLTDSNQIPIIDQPSTSSYPKMKQKSKKTQRKEAKVPQDETEHEETQVLDLEIAKDAQAKEIVALKKRVQGLERKKKSRTTGLKRLKKVSMSRRVESSKYQESLGDHKDASKQGRSIKDIDKDADVTLVDETQERQDDDLMFDIGVLDTDEMHVEAKIDEKDEQSTKLDDSTLVVKQLLMLVLKVVCSYNYYGNTLAQTLFKSQSS